MNRHNWNSWSWPVRDFKETLLWAFSRSTAAAHVPLREWKPYLSHNAVIYWYKLWHGFPSIGARGTNRMSLLWVCSSSQQGRDLLRCSGNATCRVNCPFLWTSPPPLKKSCSCQFALLCERERWLVSQWNLWEIRAKSGMSVKLQIAMPFWGWFVFSAIKGREALDIFKLVAFEPILCKTPTCSQF